MENKHLIDRAVLEKELQGTKQQITLLTLDLRQYELIGDNTVVGRQKISDEKTLQITAKMARENAQVQLSAEVRKCDAIMEMLNEL